MEKGHGFSFFAGAGLFLAILSGLGAVAAGLGTRWGTWDFRTGLAVFRWSAYGAVGAVALSAVGILSTLRFVRWSSFLWGLLGLLIGGTLVVVSWQLMETAKSAPRIHDITTDTENPPKFVAIIPLRKNAVNSLEYGGPAIAEQQRKAYPDIVPLFLKVPPDAAFDKALSAARGMGWEIVAADRKDGRIEAVATTFWFGFRDDVAIRVEKSDSGSRVDVRSVSRVGVSDLGTNARRIREFLAKMKGA